MTKSKRMYFEKLDIELKKVEVEEVAEEEAEVVEVAAEYLFGNDRVIRFPIIIIIILLLLLCNNFRNRKIKNYFFPFSVTSTLYKRNKRGLFFWFVKRRTHTQKTDRQTKSDRFQCVCDSA
jgi:hypothetical protein